MHKSGIFWVSLSCQIVGSTGFIYSPKRDPLSVPFRMSNGKIPDTWPLKENRASPFRKYQVNGTPVTIEILNSMLFIRFTMLDHA
jgi:hypothetical protein